MSKNLGQPGVHHINLNNDKLSVKKPTIQRYTTKEHTVHFNHPVIGYFKTIAGMMAWLESPTNDEVYRTLDGNTVERTVRMKRERLITTQLTGARIADSIFRYVLGNEDLSNALIETGNLPLSYYSSAPTSLDANTGKCLTFPDQRSNILVKSYTEIRSAIIEKREPDVSAVIEGFRGNINYNDLGTFIVASVPSEDGASDDSKQKPFLENKKKKKKKVSKISEKDELPSGNSDERLTESIGQLRETNPGLRVWSRKDPVLLNHEAPKKMPINGARAQPAETPSPEEGINTVGEPVSSSTNVINHVQSDLSTVAITELTSAPSASSVDIGRSVSDGVNRMGELENLDILDDASVTTEPERSTPVIVDPAAAVAELQRKFQR